LMPSAISRSAFFIVGLFMLAPPVLDRVEP
jgi:hypothetical protein